jgi:hypothetical protein
MCNVPPFFRSLTTTRLQEMKVFVYFAILCCILAAMQVSDALIYKIFSSSASPNPALSFLQSSVFKNVSFQYKTITNL